MVRAFLKDESGATAVEYGLVASLVIVVIVATLKGVGTKLTAKFTGIANALN